MHSFPVCTWGFWQIIRPEYHYHNQEVDNFYQPLNFPSTSSQSFPSSLTQATTGLLSIIIDELTVSWISENWIARCIVVSFFCKACFSNSSTRLSLSVVHFPSLLSSIPLYGWTTFVFLLVSIPGFSCYE